MTKPTDDGLVFERTYADLEEVSLQAMDKLKFVVLALKDAPGIPVTAFDYTLELYRDEAERLRIITLLKHKHLTDAGRAAERLAATNKGLFGT